MNGEIGGVLLRLDEGRDVGDMGDAFQQNPIGCKSKGGCENAKWEAVREPMGI